MYKLKYEKRYGSSFRNPWSQEELLKNGIRSFGSSDMSMWIKSGSNTYCFVKDYDKIEEALQNLSASEANDFLESNYDRKENIKEIVEKLWQ